MSPSPGPRVTAVDPYDVRFPTSREPDGFDAMNPDPDRSAAYVVLRTDAADGPEGHGFAFTTGRGNEVEAVAAEALRGQVAGRSVGELCADRGTLSRDLVGDGRLRRLGPEPEKGVTPRAIGAVVEAGIRVTCVNPADTPWIGRLPDAAVGPAVERAALEARRPTGRPVTAAEVAVACG
ncbi:hypothetical protein ACFF45_18845, partial [Streptomyces cinereospinus]